MKKMRGNLPPPKPPPSSKLYIVHDDNGRCIQTGQCKASDFEANRAMHAAKGYSVIEHHELLHPDTVTVDPKTKEVIVVPLGSTLH